ncbi:uncharacterized protein BO88DRAFT_418431 [Aspergillus vadensis CBS 113365]|uniref:GXWXG domain-containing protein n=1 Tax=Aspergillus vadensis (strain CBS 113365 / IMI 142717 / IBT 24658) TaxID=1448311 RepID=A0A319B1T1_ASPVC|nr:hypothetical protein BO88DRAFT_418431 [Aspergillus vadensis CBS 113365]PYH65794.1 hypothetical protein BO88DRAFT_418431 [Aspergillus vadensis CBS 113365]
MTVTKPQMYHSLHYTQTKRDPRPVEEYFLSLIKQQDCFDSSELQDVFDHLPGVQPDVLLGEWEAHILRSGHPSDSVAEKLLPLIKVVHSRTSVTKYSLDGKIRKSLPDWGDMFLSEITYRGVSSAALIYDDHPRVDYLRYVNEHTIAGAHWSKKEDEAGVVYFYLSKH